MSSRLEPFTAQGLEPTFCGGLALSWGILVHGLTLSSHFQAVKPQLLQPIICHTNPGKTVPAAPTFPAHRTNTGTATARGNEGLPARLQLL